MSIEKGMSRQNQWRKKRQDSTCLRHSQCLFEYFFQHLSFLSFFLSLSLFPSSLTRRDIWCRPLPQSWVPSAISSALKPLQLQTPTVSSPLFHPVLLRSPLTTHPHVPSTLSLIFPFQSLARFSRFARALRRRSPAPFTFAHYSRKSNFVTRAGSSIRARIPSSIPGKLHVGRHRRLERRFPLSSAASFYHPGSFSTAYWMSTYTQQSTPSAYNDTHMSNMQNF